MNIAAVLVYQIFKVSETEFGILRNKVGKYASLTREITAHGLPTVDRVFAGKLTWENYTEYRPKLVNGGKKR
jgi:hypothetical protein